MSCCYFTCSVPYSACCLKLHSHLCEKWMSTWKYRHTKNPCNGGGPLHWRNKSCCIFRSPYILTSLQNLLSDSSYYLWMVWTTVQVTPAGDSAGCCLGDLQNNEYFLQVAFSNFPCLLLWECSWIYFSTLADFYVKDIMPIKIIWRSDMSFLIKWGNE